MKNCLLFLAACTAIFACNQEDKKAERTAAQSDTIRNANAVDQALSDLKNQPTDNEFSKIDSANLTAIQWLGSQEIDMGKIKEGEKLNLSFRFKNTGTKPLVISSAKGSCGCTVTETPKEPFSPGQEGVIKAVFDSQGKPGLNKKEIYVYANTNPSMSLLVFNVEVLKK